MKKYLPASTVLLSLLSVGVGCHSGSSSESSSAPPVATTQPSKPVPPDSMFAKVRMGESEDEVNATIGQPTSIENYQTGKAWIPFHYSGSDNMRRTGHYKGVGTITFSLDSAYSSRFSVISIDYDPNEPGFAK